MASTFIVDFNDNVVGGNTLIPAAAKTADANGAAVDFLKADGQTHLVVLAGAIDLTDTDETYTVKLQESDTSGGTYSDISGASVTITANDQVKLLTTNKRSKRWVRAALDVGGTTPSIFVSAYVFARLKITGSGSGNYSEADSAI